MNALADDTVAELINEHFTASFLKVGTFRIVGGAKQGGNVASYFCTSDGSVLHAVAGQVDAATLLREARWAHETRKAAITAATNLSTGKRDAARFRAFVQRAHAERFSADGAPFLVHFDPFGRKLASPKLPATMPHGGNALRVHWLLASRPMAPLESIYPYVWQRILEEKLSTLPVATN